MQQQLKLLKLDYLLKSTLVKLISYDHPWNSTYLVFDYCSEVADVLKSTLKQWVFPLLYVVDRSKKKRLDIRNGQSKDYS